MGEVQQVQSAASVSRKREKTFCSFLLLLLFSIFTYVNIIYGFVELCRFRKFLHPIFSIFGKKTKNGNKINKFLWIYILS